MKQAAYPEIARSLLDVEKSIRVEKGIENGSENGNRNILEDQNPEKILARIQKIHHLMLKEKHLVIHSKISSREGEIIQQISNGKTTDEIAKILNLSKHTVESHRTNIFSKLDVRNVAELVALAFRVGLVV
ncbi:MAG: helix-turn-helix transcriptional regulator [Saprospiraceae bacterium]|jgi:DNA-binding CsgD family transcriptional regulator|nr:helix-turn-helix transcriptional regulator [Saprospiraceae bacterium]